MRRNIFAIHTDLYPRNEVPLRYVLHKLECFFFLKRSETGRELPVLSTFKIEDANCLFTAITHAVCVFAALLLLRFWCVNSYFLSFVTLTNAICLLGTLTHVFCLFFPLTSTICFFILCQDMPFYVPVILSLWHILFPFAGLANSYVALFSQ